MNTFNLLVHHLLESNIAGAGGVFGDVPSMNQGGAVSNKDFYEPNSAVIPKILGKPIKRPLINKNKRKGKKNKK